MRMFQIVTQNKIVKNLINQYRHKTNHSCRLVSNNLQKMMTLYKIQTFVSNIFCPQSIKSRTNKKCKSLWIYTVDFRLQSRRYNCPKLNRSKSKKFLHHPIFGVVQTRLRHQSLHSKYMSLRLKERDRLQLIPVFQIQ